MATKGTPAYGKDVYQKQLNERVRRFKVIWIVLLAIFVAVILRLLYVQVIRAGWYTQEAAKHRSQSSVLFHRGRILDRNGVILAQDSVLYDVYAHPRYYRKTTPEEIAQALAPILHKPVAKLTNQLKKPYDTIAIAKDLQKEQALAIRKLKLSGLDVPKKMVRRYPQGHLASHLIGYVNADATISSGVEFAAEKLLREKPSLPNLEINAKGDFVNVQDLNPALVTDLPHAQDVALTIDARIQHAAEQALSDGLKRTHAQRGAAIVMNPKNGEILAFSVLPDFDPEQYAKTPPSNLKNWAITDVYPPGSTFKILTIASGLETGVINKDTKINDTGFIKMNGFTIKNYDYGKNGAPGLIDLVHLFQHSSNIGSLTVSLMMNPQQHHDLIAKFGLGQKTGIEIPGESSGILHPASQWDRLTHATIGYGYGLAATPIQMVAAVASIANKGLWITPHLMLNEKNIQTHRVLSPKTTETLTDLLVKSIETAKTSTVRLDGFHLAGKTGTSRKPNDKGKGYTDQVFTSFVGYFPAYDPKVLIMVVVDSPGIGEAWGSTVAGPIFKELATQTIGYMGLKPDKVQRVTQTKLNPHPTHQQG